jgi:hypothetical protein
VTGWEYYAVAVERQTSFEKPSTIARRRPGAPDAEWLTDEGRWRRTDVFDRRADDDAGVDLVPIDRDRAGEIAAQAVADGLIPGVPEDLA